MTKTIAIQEFMTPSPHTIGRDISVKVAADLMRKENIRHLPVQTGRELIGIISDRDLKLAASFGDPATLTAEDVMSPDPYSVTLDTPLVDVVAQMAARKFGAVIVQDKIGKVVGIFTAIDAMNLLKDRLSEK